MRSKSTWQSIPVTTPTNLQQSSWAKSTTSVNKPTFPNNFVNHHNQQSENKNNTESHTHAVQVLVPNLCEGQRTVHHRQIALKEQSLIQLDYAYKRSSIPTHKKWKVHTILTCVETTTGLCIAIPTSKKGPTRYQLTQLKKFVMENGFGQSIIQVDNEPAIKQLAEEAVRELTIPRRQS
eukprot:3212954-Amphidinium_carterae.4